MPQIEEYVLTIGIRCDPSRDVAFENFQVLFKEKTEQIISFLFESVAPRIKQIALALQHTNKLNCEGPFKEPFAVQQV